MNHGRFFMGSELKLGFRFQFFTACVTREGEGGKGGRRRGRQEREGGGVKGRQREKDREEGEEE